jgi:hypothetical protein
MNGNLPWLVCWACRAGTRDFCSAMAALLCPVQNIFFITEHYFNSCVPIALQAGQAVVLGRCVSGAYTTTLYVMVLDGLFYHEGMRV